MILGSDINQLIGSNRDVLPNSIFTPVRISLIRVGCPGELEASRQNQARNVPIVVSRNRRGIGKIEATGFCPEIIVAAGGARRIIALEAGAIRAWVWAEKWVKSRLNIQADDSVSSSELMEKLQAALNARIAGPLAQGAGGLVGPGQQYPWILEIYPFESYMIFRHNGKSYRQGFYLDPVGKAVKLAGPQTLVEQKFITADAESMLRVQTGQQYFYAPARGNNQTVSRGAKNSELMTQTFRNWTNILDEAERYVKMTKTGAYKPLVPSFAPVALSTDNKIVGALAAMGIPPLSFALWSVQEQGKPRSRGILTPTLGAQPSQGRQNVRN